MPPSTPTARFWRWFRASGDRIRDLAYGDDPEAREEALEELRKASAKAGDFVLEVGPIEDGLKTLVFSADGRPERIDEIKELVATAPELPDWRVVAFRPRMVVGENIEISIQGELVGPDDIWFHLEEGDQGLDLVLYVRGLTEANERVRGLGAMLLAQHAVGEIDWLTLIGSLDVQAAPPDPAGEGLRPFGQLVRKFDEVGEKRYPPPGRLALDAEGSWQGMRGSINDAFALVLLNVGLAPLSGHPAYDRRLEVALPFHEVREDGMPGTEEEYDAIQDAGERVGSVLEEGQQSLLVMTIMSAGRRRLVFYTSDLDEALHRVERLRPEVAPHELETSAEYDTFWGMYRAFADNAEKEGEPE